MTVHFVVWLWTVLGQIWHAAALVNQPVFKQCFKNSTRRLVLYLSYGKR